MKRRGGAGLAGLAGLLLAALACGPATPQAGTPEGLAAFQEICGPHGLRRVPLRPDAAPAAPAADLADLAAPPPQPPS